MLPTTCARPSSLGVPPSLSLPLCSARARLPAWLRPSGQQQYQFHRLSSEEGALAAAAAGRPPGRWCPEESAGALSRLSFGYVGGLIGLGYRQGGRREEGGRGMGRLLAAAAGCAGRERCRCEGQVPHQRACHAAAHAAAGRRLTLKTCGTWPGRTAPRAWPRPSSGAWRAPRAWCGAPCGAPTAASSSWVRAAADAG